MRARGGREREVGGRKELGMEHSGHGGGMEVGWLQAGRRGDDMVRIRTTDRREGDTRDSKTQKDFGP